MLSTKIIVSLPEASRNSSAMVRPESATRSREPGGSFIWPKTMATLSMTWAVSFFSSVYSASCISSQRSLPSRVRSPTPQNTE